MKILLINAYVEWGGAEQIVRTQSRILKEKGHIVKCLTLAKGKENGTAIDYLQLKRMPGILPFLRPYLNDPLTEWHLKKILNAFQPDAVILHNIHLCPFPIYRAVKGWNTVKIVHDYSIICPRASYICYGTGTPCNVTNFASCMDCRKKDALHTVWWRFQCRKARKRRALEQKVVRLFLPCSSCLTQILLRTGYPAQTLHNSIALLSSAPAKASHGLRYIYAGGLSQTKGAFLLVKAFGEFAKQIPQAHLDLYGADSLAQENQKLKAEIEREKRWMQYHGRISHKDFLEKLKQADFLIVPSLCVENYSTLILEAMACAKVVIASDRGGNVELLDHGRGICYHANSIESCIEGMKKSARLTTEEYSKMVTLSRKYISENNNEETYYNHLLEALNDSKHMQ
jgi:glycosyltransferase involved in cell wall biosynthesis